MNIQGKTSLMGDSLYQAAAVLLWLISFALLFGAQGLQARVAEVPDRVPVLIAFSENPGPSEEALVRGLGGTIKYTYHLVPAIATTMPQQALEALQSNPRVTRIEPDGQIQAVDAELDNSWGVKRIGAGTVHVGGNSGTGVAVAVIDSGIDYTHLDLGMNYMGGYDFVNDDSDPWDDNGHGTHVAGTVAAENDGSGVVGAAPLANLYALKILDASGNGAWSDVIAALEWCVVNSCLVTNNSYTDSNYPGDTVRDAFNNAAAAGILHVAASGNSTHFRRSCNSVGYPAKFASVIAVAATDKTDSRASFSCMGAEVELAAPGVDINSTLPGDDYGSKNGTSMASPHVAGTAALIIAAGMADMDGDGHINDEVRTCLQNTADDLGDVGRDSQTGYGIVDASEAVSCGGSIPEDTTAPAAPTNLTASGGDGQVRLDWDDNTESDLAGYNVYRSTTSGTGYSLIDTSTTSGYTDSSVSNDTTYYYVVTAVDTSDNESADSNEDTGTPHSSGGSGELYTTILGSRAISNGSTWSAEVDIQVSFGSEVVSVSVVGHWSTGETTSCTESCTVHKSGIRKRTGSVTFYVDTVDGSTEFEGAREITVLKP